MVRYKVVDGVKCVDINPDEILTVDIKGWSRIFQYANRDLILKEDKRLRLYDAETNNVIAIYEESLNKKPVIRKKL